jgi:glutaredoxin-like protein
MGMIRESDAETIRDLFGLLSRDVHLRVFVRLDATDFEKATAGLMEEVGALSERVRFDLIDLNENEAAAAEAGIERTPAILIESGDKKGIRFFGVPAGGEFGVLIETILDAGTDRPSSLSTDTLKALEQIAQPVHLQVFFTPSCPHCPQAVRLAQMFAMASDQITADLIEAGEFQDLIQKYNIQGVPKTVINETIDMVGAQPENVTLQHILQAAQGES